MHLHLELRPYSADDQEFIFRLYASTRIHEIASLGWPPAQQDAFLRMQFNAQRGWYAQAYAQADHQIILLDGQPVGRIMVVSGPGSEHLVDIALLPEYRGRGIGTQLVRELVQKAVRAGSTVRLQVMRTNPAIHLYERLGFIKISEDAMYIQMATTR